MSASDHLSPGQFMPMHELLKLRSPNYDTASGNPSQRDRTTVHDRFGQIERDINRYPRYFGAVRDSMQQHGQTRPLAVGTTTFDDGSPEMLNGHHRTYLAHQLGWQGMHVVRDPEYGADDAVSEDREFDKRNPWGR